MYISYSCYTIVLLIAGHGGEVAGAGGGVNGGQHKTRYSNINRGVQENSSQLVGHGLARPGGALCERHLLDCSHHRVYEGRGWAQG